MCAQEVNKSIEENTAKKTGLGYGEIGLFTGIALFSFALLRQIFKLIKRK